MYFCCCFNPAANRRTDIHELLALIDPESDLGEIYSRMKDVRFYYQRNRIGNPLTITVQTRITPQKLAESRLRRKTRETLRTKKREAQQEGKLKLRA